MRSKKHGFYRAVAGISLILTAFAAASVLIPSILLIGKNTARTSAGNEQAKIERIYDEAAEGKVLRLHIVANSDSAEDQAVKLAVRDAVLKYENECCGEAPLAGDPAEQRAETALLKDGEGLRSAVAAALKECGAEYSAQLVLGESPFPDRVYSGTLYPAGNYRSLRILLGRAEGHNWWCILFPPLCLTELTPAEAAPTETPSASPGYDQPAEPVRFESLIVKLFRWIIGGEK